MLKKVHVVINIIGGIVDNVDVFAEEKDAQYCYREIIEANSPFSRKEIITIHGAEQEFDDIWRKDSHLYLYNKDIDSYFPISTEYHDVFMSSAFIDYE